MRKIMSFITNGGVVGMNTETEIKSRDELIENLSNLYESFNSYKQKERKTIENKIKDGLADKMLPGDVQELINDPSKLNEVGIDKVYLLAERTYEVLKKSTIDPKLYFTKREIKEIKTTFTGYEDDKIEFPYTFHNVDMVNEGDYFLSIDPRENNSLFEGQALQYNFETQREARQHAEDDEIIKTPKLHEKNVREMVALGEKGKLVSTMFTYNARLGSSDEGEELIYDEYNRTLTVTKGTYLDVLDGFHRLNAISRLLRINPNIKLPKFKLNILNLDKRGAQEYFGQINTTAPIAKSHLNAMKESRQSDFIAKYIQNNSELSDRMAAGDRIASGSNLLVTFSTISDSIEDVYKIRDKATAIKEAQYLTEFIDTLFMYFPEEFLSNNISKIRKSSLINANSIFYGYILLSKLLKDEGIPLSKLKNIIDDIDFSRNNPMWADRKLIGENGRITATKAKSIIYKIFKEINLDKYK